MLAEGAEGAVDSMSISIGTMDDAGWRSESR